MREPKFRAWDTGKGTENKGMVYMETESLAEFFNYLEMCTDAYGIEWVLMQSTERFDMDGNEIYAGDIVGKPHYCKSRCTGKLIKNGHTGVRVVEFKHSTYTGFNIGDMSKCEVMGNTYQSQILKGDEPAWVTSVRAKFKGSE